MDRNLIDEIQLEFNSVALRKESVDRNKIRIATIDCIIDVALRKESVDRNLPSMHCSWTTVRRSPQGERG